MSVSTSAVFEPLRIDNFEMPWNRVLQSPTDTVAGAARALGPWHPQEFLAECVETEPEAGDMMNYVFRRVDGAPLAFRPGQYVNIAFPVDGNDAETVDRSYSLSSSPTQPWTFSITVKREDNGKVSGWVHDNVKPGTVLDMLGPVGAFHLPDADPAPRYLFLAAGSGITPVMSMVRSIHSLPGKADVVMLYHSTRPGGFAFSRELEYLTSVDSRIRVFYSLGDRQAPTTWVGMAGHLTTSMIEQVAPDLLDRHVYACGPEGYLDSAAELLRSLGVEDTEINMEFFSGDRQTTLEYEDELAIAEEIAGEVAAAVGEYYAAQPPALDIYAQRDSTAEETAAAGPPSSGFGQQAEGPPASGFGHQTSGPPSSGFGAPVDAHANAPAVADAPTNPAADTDAIDAAGYDTDSFQTVGEGVYKISFVRSRLNIMVSEDEKILQAARREGIRIGMNCQEGMCGSCKSVKLEGEVDMHHQGGIRPREIEAGKFLPCCSTAVTDVVIDA